MIGYIGTVLLIITYVILNTRYSKYFLIMNILASGTMTIHAIIIHDIPFILVNGFVTIMTLIRVTTNKIGHKDSTLA